MTTRFARDAAAGGNGSADAPYRDPGDLPTPWLATPGEEYLFHPDAGPYNFAGCFANAGYATSPIVLGTWGGNGRATIQKYRMLDRSECVEVAFSSGDTTAPQAGTNLWRMPRQFFGLFAGRVWGVRCDVTGAVNANAHTPSAPGEWTYADANTSTVVYSPGNPVDVFGGVFVNSVPDADYATAYKRYAVYGNQCALVISGIDFKNAYGGWRAYPGAVQGRLLAGLDVESSASIDVYHGIALAGDGSRTTAFNGSGCGFVGAKLRDLYGENLGADLITTPGAGLCLNRLRMSEFVVAGCGLAESTGGVYMDHAYTTDGERGIIELGTVSGQKAFRFWPTDGYGFYGDRYTGGFEWCRLLGWNNDQAFHLNYPGADNVHRQCVSFASPNTPASSDEMISVQGPVSGSELTAIGCVAIGHRRFFKVVNGSGTYLARLRENVSRCGGDPGGASNTNFARMTGYSAANWKVSGNAIFGHDYKLYDSAGVDHSADVTGTITADPASEIARIVVPKDPSVNYARQISPNFWSGAVDLRSWAMPAAA